MKQIWRHWRAGTLGSRIRARLFGRMPVAERVRWLGADNENEAVEALLAWGRSALAGTNGWLLLLGDDNALGRRAQAAMQRAGLAHRRLQIAEALALSADDTRNVAAVLCTESGTRSQTHCAREISGFPPLADKPFEYVYGLDPARAAFHHLDEYAATDFVSPLLLDEPSPYAIYEESLALFEQKCGLRDYLDLYQILAHVVRNRIPGDIAEFGSYKGHSGWLIARSLEALGDTRRRVFLFDTFDCFPEETGLDHFWTDTHRVDFESIRRKFADYSTVQLVRGDFTQTLPESGLAQVALAYVDCDSHRATKWLIETLWPERISHRGAMVFEDYGHPALLGNRVAIHDVFDQFHDGIKNYSQFSGLYSIYNA